MVAEEQRRTALNDLNTHSPRLPAEKRLEQADTGSGLLPPNPPLPSVPNFVMPPPPPRPARPPPHHLEELQPDAVEIPPVGGSYRGGAPKKHELIFSKTFLGLAGTFWETPKPPWDPPHKRLQLLTCWYTVQILFPELGKSSTHCCQEVVGERHTCTNRRCGTATVGGQHGKVKCFVCMFSHPADSCQNFVQLHQTSSSTESWTLVDRGSRVDSGLHESDSSSLLATGHEAGCLGSDVIAELDPSDVLWSLQLLLAGPCSSCGSCDMTSGASRLVCAHIRTKKQVESKLSGARRRIK